MLTSPEGKMYIGMAEMPVEKRWANGKNYKNNKALNADIQKFGWENFQHEVLYDELTKEEAQITEAQMVADLVKACPDKSYNGQIPKVNPDRNHYTVYQLVFPDGKQYIGKTGGDFKKRWANGKGYRTNKELTKAIKEWGKRMCI